MKLNQLTNCAGRQAVVIQTTVLLTQSKGEVEMEGRGEGEVGEGASREGNVTISGDLEYAGGLNQFME